MQIAICDDDINFAEGLKGAIETLYDVSNGPLTVSVWHDGAAFLVDQPECDALFLAIAMAGVDGFTIARKLRRREEIFLIFVTGHDELVYDAIKFQPFRFLRKSRLPEELPEAVNSLMTAVLRRSAGSKVPFRTGTGIVYRDVDDIIYIEIYGHWMHVCVRGGDDLKCYGSLTDLEKQLKAFGFVRTHKSYLVNCRYIDAIESRRVILTDQTQILLSRYRAEAVREAYGNFGLRSTTCIESNMPFML